MKTSIMLQIINVMYLSNILQNFSSSPLKAAILTTTEAIKTSQNKLSKNKTKKLSEPKSVILNIYFVVLLFSYIKNTFMLFLT